MINFHALTALAVAVETGKVGSGLNTFGAFGDNHIAMNAVDAFHDSIDAAVAFHEAMLPEFVWSVGSDGFARVAQGGRVLTVMQSCNIENKPARALFLADLRALISRGEVPS